MEKYIEVIGDLEDVDGSAHFGLDKIRMFLDKLSQKNDKIISTQSSISNMRGNSGNDKGSNADKKAQKERYPKAQDVKANKASITKGENCPEAGYSAKA